MTAPDTLIIILGARISEWGAKGELAAGYFNPAGRFRHIVILSLVRDQIEDGVLDYLCGDAAWRYLSLPLLDPANLVKTRGFAPGPVRRWLKKRAVPLIDAEQPVIRAYGDGISGMIAALLAELLQCRAIASIHTTVTTRPDGPPASLKLRLLEALEARARRFAHARLDALAPVYSPALVAIPPQWHGKCHIIPNAVRLPDDAVKRDYHTEKTLHLVSIGRMVAGKSPLPVLAGLVAMNDWHLTLIGDGPEREKVLEFVADHDLQDRVRYIPRMDNAALIAGLKDYDAFIAYTAFAEIPKTVIEAGLAGLPVILNTPTGNQPAASEPAEYEDAPLLWCDGSPEGYAVALQVLQDHREGLADLGGAMRDHFSRWFNPARAGQAMADLLLADGPSVAPSSGQEL